MNWVRGRSLGSGSFASVNLAKPKKTSTLFHSPTAVKTSNVNSSSSLKNEEQILHCLGSCPQIVKCFGHDQTVENGEEYYNLFLEYAAGGTLADQLKNHSGRRFPETLVRRYARSILEGLHHVHSKGFVHCDIKLQNILVFDNGDVKIADFGLAKEKGEIHSTTWECRGTPLFLSPEAVNDSEYEPPADIWALGCAVVEMVTGKPAWNVDSGTNTWFLLVQIGMGEELPQIPDELSKHGKDFLEKCFVKDPKKRWSAEMLLEHPFIADDIVPLEQVKEKEPLPCPSPRTHFDWVSTVTTTSVPATPNSGEWKCSPADRLQRLVGDQVPTDWFESESWTIVRSS